MCPVQRTLTSCCYNIKAYDHDDDNDMMQPKEAEQRLPNDGQHMCYLLKIIFFIGFIVVHTERMRVTMNAVGWFDSYTS